MCSYTVIIPELPMQCGFGAFSLFLTSKFYEQGALITIRLRARDFYEVIVDDSTNKH